MPPSKLLLVAMLALLLHSAFSLSSSSLSSSLYTVSITSLPAAPVISYIAGQTPWPQSFNPAFVEASAGTNGVRGLIVRSQNCTFTPGTCVHCNVPSDAPNGTFVGSVLSFAAQASDGTFATPYLVYAPEPGLDAELRGTEDPRLTYDPTSGLYHLFYTCYGKGASIALCHSTTANPTEPYPGEWTRHGAVTAGKSAALLIRPSPPHYLYQGDSSIALWTSPDLYNFTKVNSTFITPRADSFDTRLVESGPNPFILSDGNYIFFHNSANKTACYHPGYVILSGVDPSVILTRSESPLLSPTRDWEVGIAPQECNVPCVVFLEAAAPVTGAVDEFDVWFGGSDAVIGTARVKVTIA